MTEEIRAKVGRKLEANPNWTGGEYLHDGRVYIHMTEAQRATFLTGRPDGYVRRSHLVWNQHHPGDPVQRHEIVHHRNEDKLDDRIENLEKMTQSDHARLHFKGKSLSPETRARMTTAQRERRKRERASASDR